MRYENTLSQKYLDIFSHNRGEGHVKRQRSIAEAFFYKEEKLGLLHFAFIFHPLRLPSAVLSHLPLPLF